MTASPFEQLAIDDVEMKLEMFGEVVTYRPAAGGTRSILAAVNREQPQGLDALPHGNAPMTIMFVKNDSTTGISSGEIDLGGDKIEYAFRIGNTPLQCRIVKMQTIDYAWLKLEVRG